MTELPVEISDEHSSIVGILRSNTKCSKLVILLPAATGTRIGPQRIYVEIARALLNINIASFSIDLPPNGDSFDNGPGFPFTTYREYLNNHYRHNLDKVINHFRKDSRYEEYILLSISVGCLPILQYAEMNHFSKVILLAPNLLDLGKRAINKKNFRAYQEKLFHWQTWKKLFSLRLNVRNIINNVFNLSSVVAGKKHLSTAARAPVEKKNVNILVVLGEHDVDLSKNQIYWGNKLTTKQCASYTEVIIQGSDHSFFGWRFKEDVKKSIVGWLNARVSASRIIHSYS